VVKGAVDGHSVSRARDCHCERSVAIDCPKKHRLLRRFTPRNDRCDEVLPRKSIGAGLPGHGLSSGAPVW